MTAPDETMIRIGRAIELIQRGEHAEARRQFAGLWEEVGVDGDPLHRLSVAHWMADLQDDPRDELAWDLRALDAASVITDERATRAGVAGPVAGFLPSLHLNLGEDYRKLGDLAAARHHLEQGQAATTVLGEDGYSAMIKRGLDALADRLSGC